MNHAIRGGAKPGPAESCGIIAAADGVFLWLGIALVLRKNAKGFKLYLQIKSQI